MNISILNTLNKTPADDSAGIAYWVGELQQGKSRGYIVATLVGVIKDYAPGGPYYNPDDAATVAAYNQFTNRVEVSDYMADMVEKPPQDWATSTAFDSGLIVTNDHLTVNAAKENILNISQLDNQVEDYTSRKLPEKFTAIMTMESLTWESQDQMINHVRKVSENAADRGIDAYNLVLNWRDLEAPQGTIKISLLSRLIYEIKKHRMLCILRVFVNTEGNWQAWPSFLSPSETYSVSGQTEILPWDKEYKTKWMSFLSGLASALASSKNQPDGLQITLGGSFGEQVLGQYDYSGWPIQPSFNEILFEAEKSHVDDYVESRLNVIHRLTRNWALRFQSTTCCYFK